MAKVHVVLNKDALRVGCLQGASAVVLDIIFATSSMMAALDAGARCIIPALDLAEAETLLGQFPAEDCLLAGEHNARSFAGYRSYEPLALQTPDMQGKTLIYATTNGTVALRRADFFCHTYIASLRNGSAVLRRLLSERDPLADIVIICAGSLGRFSLEDFYGAGCLVSGLQRSAVPSLDYSDTALAAALAFRNTDPYEVLMSSRLGRLMCDRGLENNIRYASQLDVSGRAGAYRDGVVTAR